MSSTPFIPGLELNKLYYWQAVRPILDRHYPGLPYAAARLGPGSDVLGFDSPMSMDHDWGPKLVLLLAESDQLLTQKITETLGMELPMEFMGYPTAFRPNEDGTAVMAGNVKRPLDHAVQVVTLGQFFRERMLWDIAEPLFVLDWLSFSTQTLREMVSGAVYHDGLGQLEEIRQELAWYPHDVWLYLMACGWQRIGQEEHLMPRAGYVGDELGSTLIGSRLVRDVMTLCFLMEKVYPPYPKWFGTAFRFLHCAAQLEPILWQVQCATAWQDRQDALSQVFELLARQHNALKITEPLVEEVNAFYSRPFLVIGGERFTQALLAQITSRDVLAAAQLGLVGSVDLFSDSTDLRSHIQWRPRLRDLLNPERGSRSPG